MYVKYFSVTALTLFLSLTAIANEAAPHFQKAKLQMGVKTVTVELAQSNDEKSHGLMFREKMSDKQGMLFVYDEEQIMSFWMKNTLIPLSIGFFDKDKKLLEVIDMEPVSVLEKDIPSYQSKSPAQYALEVNKGWFVRNKIKLGTKFSLKK